MFRTLLRSSALAACLAPGVFAACASTTGPENQATADAIVALTGGGAAADDSVRATLILGEHATVDWGAGTSTQYVARTSAATMKDLVMLGLDDWSFSTPEIVDDTLRANATRNDGVECTVVMNASSRTGEVRCSNGIVHLLSGAPRTPVAVYEEATYRGIYPDLRAAYGDNHAAYENHWRVQGLPWEGRRASPHFDPKYYLSQFSDLRTAFGPNGYRAGADHFSRQGFVHEGRRGSLEFDAVYYLNRNPDLVDAFGPAGYGASLQHWLTQGLPVEGRAGSSDFDPRYYLAANPDVARVYGATNYRGALDHFLTYGKLEGRAGALVLFTTKGEPRPPQCSQWAVVAVGSWTAGIGFAIGSAVAAATGNAPASFGLAEKSFGFYLGALGASAEWHGSGCGGTGKRLIGDFFGIFEAP